MARVHDICASASDALTFRLEVLSELRRAIEFDAHVWLLTDPVTTVGSSPLAEVPIDDLPGLIRARYRARADTPDASAWLAILDDHGIADVATTVFSDRHGCWGFLDLWRRAPRGPFPAATIDLMAEIAPPIATALRRCQALTFTVPAEPMVRGIGPVVLVLGPDLRVQSQTEATGDWLGRLVPPTPGHSPIPAIAYNVAAQLLVVEAQADRHPAMARVHLGGGSWVTARAARLGSPLDGGRGAIAVSIETSSPIDRVEVFGRAFGLSPRESEILAILGTGVSTADLADRLFVTEHTIQDHLKSIFEKTGSHSRAALLSRAVGLPDRRPRSPDVAGPPVGAERSGSIDRRAGNDPDVLGRPSSVMSGPARPDPPS